MIILSMLTNKSTINDGLIKNKARKERAQSKTKNVNQYPKLPLKSSPTLQLLDVQNNESIK